MMKFAQMALCMFAIAVVPWFVAAGCVKRSDGGAQGRGARSAEIRIGYFANLTHAQAVLGIASGDFDEAVAPSKLSTKVFSAGPSLIEALFADEIDVGYVGPGPAINAFARTRGEGLRIIAGGAANGVVIVARAGSGIEKLEDLKDRMIATPQLGNTQDLAARHFVTATLGQTHTDNIIPINNAEQGAMMTRGQIDAAWVPEPWGTRLITTAGGKIIAEEKDLWPDHEFGLTVIVTTPQYLAEHSDVVRKLLSAHRAWTARLNGDPQKYVPNLAAAMTQITGKKIGEPLLKDAIRHVKFTDQPNTPTLVVMAQRAYDLKYLKTLPSLETLVDTSLLVALQRQQPQLPAGRFTP